MPQLPGTMINNRPTRDALNIQIASLIAQRGTCQRLNVGCVIVRDNRAITSGYNGPTKGTYHCSSKVCNVDMPCERAVHAEANAIAYAAKKGIALEDAHIYCTHQPCKKCAELIITAGITEVYYLNSYRITDGLELLKQNGIKTQRINEKGIPVQV